MMARPDAVQQRVFSTLVRRGKTTEFGKKYRFGSISTVREFQQQVPVSTYEDLFPYIERMMRGENNVLWSSPVRWFSKSSGTTNARSKFIPVSPESLDECHLKGGKDQIGRAHV